MGKAITSYDVQLRLAYLAKAIAYYGNDLMLKKKLGDNCKESECKLKLLGIYAEILSCYKDPCSTIDYECYTEIELQNIFNIITKLTGYCFPPTGVNRATNACIPNPVIVPGSYSPLCTNPIQNLIDSVNNGSDLSDILDTGLMIPKSIYCCPECGIYSMAKVDEFLKLAEVIGLTNGEPMYTCTNLTVKSTIDTYLKLAEAMDISSYSINNTTSAYVNEYLKNIAAEDKETIEDIGLVEFGKFTSYNTINLILSAFTTEQIIDVVLEKGITVICDGDYVVIGSIETILKYIEPTLET